LLDQEAAGMKALRIVLLAGALLAAGLVGSAPTAASPGSTERVSVDSAGNQSGGGSLPGISGDGRYVAFSSGASNLVPNDTNERTDVFVHDRQTGATERVSLDGAGNEGNDHSGYPVMSWDGRYVAFMSFASNLVPGDTNGASDVFLHDRQTGVTERVSLDSGGNEGNGRSWEPAISADGRYVAFQSEASNLVPGDTNGCKDVFVRDRQAGVTERVSLDSAGGQANGDSLEPAMSADGRYVAFDSAASNLIPDDTNGAWDAFVHDRQTEETARVSVDSLGGQANGSSAWVAISADGRCVAFSSGASNLVPGDTNGWDDVFLHDRETGTTERLSVDSAGGDANDQSTGPVVSADGHYVAFWSIAIDLVPADTNETSDVFVRDRQAGITERASLDSADNEGNDWSDRPTISADGRYVAFHSYASNLVPGDTNAEADVFVRDRALAADADGDGVPDGSDVCPDTPQGQQVDGNGCSDAQVDADGDGICDPGAASPGPSQCQLDPPDNCPDVYNPDQLDSEQPPDQWGDVCDPDTGNSSDVSGPDGSVSLSHESGTIGFAGTTAEPGRTVTIQDDAAGVGSIMVTAKGNKGKVTKKFDTVSTSLLTGTVLAVIDFDPAVEQQKLNNMRVTKKVTGPNTEIPYSLDGSLCIGGWCTQATISFLIQDDATFNAIVPADTDSDGVYDQFDLNDDGDLDDPDELDNCVLLANPGQENADGDEWGDACDNCPTKATLWYTPLGDDDCDGFSTADEGQIGTDPADDCSDNPSHDAWPPDIAGDEGCGWHNGQVNIMDVLCYKPKLTGPYDSRYDLTADGQVNILDVLLYKPVLNTSCTSP
jgi:Tol biopolymer transport system component